MILESSSLVSVLYSIEKRLAELIAHRLFPYFLEKRLAIPTFLISFTSNWFLRYYFPYFFRQPLTLLILVVGFGGGKKLNGIS